MKYILVNSNNLRNQLLSDEGVDKIKIIEIKNGIKEISFERKDLLIIKKNFKAKGILSKDNVIVCLANLIPYKPHIHLINSLKYNEYILY